MVTGTQRHCQINSKASISIVLTSKLARRYCGVRRD